MAETSAYIGTHRKFCNRYTGPCRLRIGNEFGVSLIHGSVVLHACKVNVDLSSLNVIGQDTCALITVPSKDCAKTRLLL